MTMTHHIPDSMLEYAWRVVVVGAGGTGSALLPNLARLHHAMLELGHPGGIECIVFDDDTVSETNVGRQGFYPNDVGQFKATLLVNRLNALMGTRWVAQTRRIASTDRLDCDLAVGCVDTRAARKAILGAVSRGSGGYYLDCGNETDTRLRQSREAVVALDARIEALIRQQTGLATERERVESVLSGLPAVQGKADRLSDEIAQWKLLAKALGNDGVIALSIDDAGPALTRIVNDLLLSCYGARFTIAIQTQTTLANGEKREGFEIEVNDADRDSVKNFALLSGGQKIWINECLTRGIALYRAQDSGQPFQTLFTDEADGPLDPERKRAFMQMKREVLRQGGYEREFFISHTPESVDEADAVIDLMALAA